MELEFVQQRILALSVVVEKAWNDAARAASLEARRSHASHDDGKGTDIQSSENKTGGSINTANKIGKDNFVAPLSSSERTSLSFYASGKSAGVPAHLEVNDYLRGSGLSEEDFANDRRLSSTLKSMDAAFAKSALPVDTTVYKGVDASTFKKLAKLQPGSTFTDKGFASTSLRSKIAGVFSKTMQKQGGTIEVRLSKGAKAISMAPFAKSNAPEAEILLNRGSKFKVLSNNKNHHLVVKLL